MLTYLEDVYDKCHKNGSFKGTTVICRLVLAVTY